LTVKINKETDQLAFDCHWHYDMMSIVIKEELVTKISFSSAFL